MVRSLFRFGDWSLRWKIAVLLVVAAVLPLATEALQSIRDGRRQVMASTAALLAARADQLGGEIDIFHRGFQGSANRTRRVPSIVAFCQDPDGANARAIGAILDVWPANDTAIRGVGILDRAGVVRAGTEPALIGVDLSHHDDYVRRALRGQEVISDVYIAEAAVGDTPTIAYLAPVHAPDRTVIGVFALWVRATSLWDMAKASNGLAGPNSFAVLFDQQGIRIAHTYSREMVFRPGGALDADTIAALVAERRFGVKTRELLSDVRPFPQQFARARASRPDRTVFRGFAPVNHSWNYGVARRLKTVPWTLFYMIPEAALDAPIANMTRHKLRFAAGIMLAGLLAGVLFARRILNPIRSLATATEAIAKGDLGARARVVQADELGRLGSSFNAMAGRIESQAAALKDARDDLERQVQQRTAALRESEDQLRQSQKMDAVGRLAGGIAHDFNNLLSVILSYTDMLRDQLKPDDPARDDLEEIKKAGMRAADLTRQMLAFSRQQVLDPKILDLNAILADINKMLVRVVGEDVELKLALESRLAMVKADPGQMEQVLLNLVVNARDAMPDGGKLTIETSNVMLTAEYASQHREVVPGPHVLLAVSDTGIGMDKATQARVFEPFFTTKEHGKGTGLGLSTVFGIIKQSGGSVWLYSEPGTGTTFKIYLPRVDAAASASRSEQPASAIVGGSETILLVEDEDQVRRVALAVLGKHGYRVLAASGPGEALLLCEQHPDRIHLLLTDVIMPKSNGRQLAEKIRAMRPDIKTIFMSGYTDNVIIHHGVLDAGVSFLQKPLMPDALARKVREVLDA